MTLLIPRCAAALVGALLLTSCERPNGFEPIGAITMTPIKGAALQTAAVNTNVAEAPEVEVRDGKGEPVAGVEVSFYITIGGGTATPTSYTTDAKGRMRVGSWTLGANPGPNRLVAVVRNSTSDASFIFEATATP